MPGRNELSFFAGFLDGVVKKIAGDRQREREDRILAERRAIQQERLALERKQVGFQEAAAARNKELFDTKKVQDETRKAQDDLVSRAFRESQITGKPIDKVISRMSEEANIPIPMSFIERAVGSQREANFFRTKQEAGKPKFTPQQQAVQRINEKVNEVVSIGRFGNHDVSSLINEFGESGFKQLVRFTEFDVDKDTGQFVKRDFMLSPDDSVTQMRVNIAKGALDNDPNMGPEFRSIDFEEDDDVTGDDVRKIIFDVTKNRNLLTPFDPNQGYSLADVALKLADQNVNTSNIIETMKMMGRFFISHKKEFAFRRRMELLRQKRARMSRREKFFRPHDPERDRRRREQQRNKKFFIFDDPLLDERTKIPFGPHQPTSSEGKSIQKFLSENP